MQIELRNGDFDYPLLESLARTIVADGNAQSGLRKLNTYRHRLTVLANPVNQGYGGNQKLGYHYAIEHGFDFVVLVHGDGRCDRANPRLARRGAARRKNYQRHCSRTDHRRFLEHRRTPLS